MKKGFFKTFAAIATAAVMTLGASVAATANGTYVEGYAQFPDYVYRVDVPTTLNFAVNPVGAATQTELVVANRTKDMPVMVSVDMTVIKGDDVNIVTPGEIDIFSVSSVDKDIYMAILGAESAAGTAATTPGELDGVTWDFATKGELTDNEDNTGYATGGELVAFTAASSGEYTAYVDFVLGAAEYNADGTFKNFSANANSGYAAFTIYSEANPSATWKVEGEPSVVSVGGAFTFTGLNGEAYTDILADEVAAFDPVGVNQVIVLPEDRPTLFAGEPEPEYDTAGFITADGEDTEQVRGSNTAPVASAILSEIRVPFFADGAALNRVVVNQATGVGTWNLPITASLDGDELVIANTVFIAKDVNQTYKIDVTLDGSSTVYSFWVRLSAA